MTVAGRRLTAPVVVQFIKFGIVGVSNTLLSFAIYTVLLKVFGVWYLAASAIGFIIGAINGFLLNRRWTFAGHVGDALTPVRWGVVQGCGLAFNLGLLYLFVDGAGVEKLLGQALATAIVTVVTFLVNRAWTFRMHHPPVPVPASAAVPVPAADVAVPAADVPVPVADVEAGQRRGAPRAGAADVEAG